MLFSSEYCRQTIPPIMKTGKVDVFAFIGALFKKITLILFFTCSGTSKAAAAIQKSHPQPHRLRVCLGLDAKNPAIVLSDADLEVAVKQCISGALSFNGQRLILTLMEFRLMLAGAQLSRSSLCTSRSRRPSFLNFALLSMH